MLQHRILVKTFLTNLAVLWSLNFPKGTSLRLSQKFISTLLSIFGTIPKLHMYVMARYHCTQTQCLISKRLIKVHKHRHLISGWHELTRAKGEQETGFLMQPCVICWWGLKLDTQLTAARLVYVIAKLTYSSDNSVYLIAIMCKQKKCLLLPNFNVLFSRVCSFVHLCTLFFNSLHSNIHRTAATLCIDHMQFAFCSNNLLSSWLWFATLLHLCFFSFSMILMPVLLVST